MRVLLVEDDDDLREVVAIGLRRSHIAVDPAATVAEAVDHLTTVDYDVVVLDLGLPDGDGVDLCHRLRSDPGLRRPGRVLMLTARDGVADRIVGLDAGADDYLVKPFDLGELTARLRALARRRDQSGSTLRLADLEIDEAAHRARRAGRDLPLTGKEFALLRHLARHPGEVLSAETLLEHCWDAHADPFTTSVRVILSRLRRKLGEPPLIHTVTGVGYRLGPAS
jgi:DNA-binding response OmpR family regulator